MPPKSFERGRDLLRRSPTARIVAFLIVVGALGRRRRRRRRREIRAIDQLGTEVVDEP